MNEEHIAIRIKKIGGADGGHVGGKLREDGGDWLIGEMTK